VRSAQGRCRFGLAPEPLEGLGRRRNIALHQLDGDDSVEIDALGGPDRAHAPTPDFGHQLVSSAQNDTRVDDHAEG
jgi:hypothetical protein